MKKSEIARRLILFKQTIAHLNDEQMSSARGGADTVTCSPSLTCDSCTKTGLQSIEFCTNKSSAVSSVKCF
jgi:hypothetical protein